jgi:hypothetical protein
MMNNRLVSMLVAVLVVTGCSSGDQAGGAAGPKAASKAATAGVEAVTAVLQSAGAPVAKVDFVVVTRPVVGAQTVLQLNISAPAPVSNLQLVAEGDGVLVDPASAKAGFVLLADKMSHHDLRFTSQREGLGQVTVRLSGGPDAAETVYAIPVLVAAAGTGG